MLTRNIIYALTLFFISYFCCASNNVPEIENGLVIFKNGVKLAYRPESILFKNPKDALRKELPVSISEKSVLIEEWGLLALVKRNYFFEGSTVSLRLYNYAGELVFPVLDITGEVHFLRKERKILLVGKSSHHQSNSSYLFSIKESKFEKIDHGEILKLIISSDEKIIWFYSGLVVDGIPVTKLSVFNNEGKYIKDFMIRKKGVVELEYLNTKYSVEVSAPDFPG